MSCQVPAFLYSGDSYDCSQELACSLSPLTCSLESRVAALLKRAELLPCKQDSKKDSAFSLCPWSFAFSHHPSPSPLSRGRTTHQITQARGAPSGRGSVGGAGGALMRSHRAKKCCWGRGSTRRCLPPPCMCLSNGARRAERYPALSLLLKWHSLHYTSTYHITQACLDPDAPGRRGGVAGAAVAVGVDAVFNQFCSTCGCMLTLSKVTARMSWAFASSPPGHPR
jgi:hypothetical protein